MEEGFVKASSDNLPLVDFTMIDDFYSEKVNTECKNIKAQRSTRPSYGDNAVAFVQLKRDGRLCTVKGKITPEHKIRSNYYQISAVIDEVEEKVLTCECHSCSASADHCKHAIAFLFWLHRRSEEPSVTSTVCYWKSSALSRVGKDVPADLAALVDKPLIPLAAKGKAFLYDVVKHCSDASGGVFAVSNIAEFHDVSMYQQSIAYEMEQNENKSPDEFIAFVSQHMTDISCKKVEKLTRDQSQCPLWFEMRFGRITASKVYEASRCQTLEGALTEVIMGASKFQPTEAICRGSALEKPVIKQVGRRKNIAIRNAGIILKKEFPLFGASPDGISDDYVIEVKCPVKTGTIGNYIHDDVVAPKVYYQMQLQMLFANKTKGLLCVAAPHFERTKEVYVKEIAFDADLCRNCMDDATHYWKQAIYPLLVKE